MAVLPVEFLLLTLLRRLPLRRFFAFIIIQRGLLPQVLVGHHDLRAVLRCAAALLSHLLSSIWKIKVNYSSSAQRN